MPAAQPIGPQRQNILDQEAELARLDQLGRQRPLTRAESDRVANLVARAQQRAYRAPARAARLREKLRRLEALAS